MCNRRRPPTIFWKCEHTSAQRSSPLIEIGRPLMESGRPPIGVGPNDFFGNTLQRSGARPGSKADADRKWTPFDRRQPPTTFLETHSDAAVLTQESAHPPKVDALGHA